MKLFSAALVPLNRITLTMTEMGNLSLLFQTKTLLRRLYYSSVFLLKKQLLKPFLITVKITASVSLHGALRRIGRDSEPLRGS